jgi:uroporphyrinogen-III decarboxylase
MNNMNSRERLLKAINGEETDRVPVTLFIQDHGHFINQLYPEIDPMDYEQITLKIIEYQKKLECDIFVRMIFDLYHPLNIGIGGMNDGVETDQWKIHTEFLDEGNNYVRKSLIVTPEGNITQEFVRTEIRKGTYVYSSRVKPIISEEILDLAIKYEPQISSEYVAKINEKIGIIKKVIGNDGILGTWVPGGVFNNASYIFDLTELYQLFLIQTDFYNKLMQFCFDRISGYTKALIDAGADVMCVSGNVPGGFLGSEIYETYILPWEKKYIDFIQDMGCPAIYHNCGEIMTLVESYKKLGARVVEPFSPRPLGDADLELAKKLINGKYVVIGGVDQENVIKNGSMDDVIEVTKKTMEAGKEGGKFIIQNADFLEWGTPEENVKAFVKTAIENAGY